MSAPPSCAGAGRRWSRRAAAVVRRRLARALLHDVAAADRAGDDAAPRRVGDVVLRPHQREACARLARALREFGGALLADAVGLGKTYVALALARGAAAPVIVAPAALRAMWRDALARTGVVAPVLSLERLGRAAPPPLPPCTLLVVDEAHALRNPAARRYARVAELARGARVLLLSATPVHNRAAELHALLALFLGARAATLDGAALARCVVRRDAASVARAGPDAARPPRALPPRWLRPPDRDDLLARLVALPPPLPARDGGAAGALVAHTLVRQWSSSAGALRAALRRRLARAEALAAALADGHHASAAELRRWVVGDDAVQLPFPELLDAAPAAPDALCTAVAAHAAALRALLADVGDRDDRARARLLRAVRRRHADHPVVAFAASADTVRALWRLLARERGVCLLTAAGARVAGGPLSRREALRRFAPRAAGAPPPPAAERITLLLATDVLSEGIGLQDAAAVVHLDLPWTPARLEQRVGRAARPGSPHAAVAVYALAPPASAEALLGVERRLRRKLRAAGRLVGGAGAGLPPPAPAPADEPHDAARSPSAAAEALRALAVAWSGGAVERARCAARGGVPRARRAVVAAVRAGPETGRALLALVRAGGRTRLLAATEADGAPTEDPRHVLTVARAAGGPDRPPTAAGVRWARGRLAAWARERRARGALAIAPPPAARLHGRLLRRIGRVVREAPRHRRPALAALAARARRLLGRRHGAAVERALADLATADLPAESWLGALAELGATSGPTRDGPPRDGAPRDGPPRERRPRLLALLLVEPDAPCDVPCQAPCDAA